MTCTFIYYGRTGTGIVLEETTNKIFIVDGYVQTFLEDGDTQRPNLIVGIQQNGTNVYQVPASPFVALVNELTGSIENDYYLFRPYIVGQPISGQGVASYAAVDTLVRNAMKNQSFPGLQVAITRRGKLVYNKAYGFASVETGLHMQPWHRACIGSSAKLLTAAGIFKLIEQGQLTGVTAIATTPELLGKDWFWDGVNDAIANNVYSQIAAAPISSVTLQHLMTMTAVYGGSGDARGTVDAYADGNYNEYTTPLAIRWFMANRALRAPQNGVNYAYSNNNYTQLGQLITERTGLPYETYIQQNILSGIGPHTMRVMRNLENEETHLDARRYRFYSSGLPHSLNLYDGELTHSTYGLLKYSEGAATGGWTSSARDLSRLLVAMDGLPNRPDILSQLSLQEMERVPFPNATNGVNQAYCWRAEYADGHIEKGGNIGYGASFIRRERAPDKLTIVVVANTDSATLPNIAIGIANMIRNVNVPPTYDLFESLPFTLD